MNDLVSIIMPSYNTGDFIAEAIKSVLTQTYANWELIIVDDCSTDSTDDIVAAFRDSRIFYLKNKENSGAAVSRNRALRKAKGKWIAFLDSDDLWLPRKLEHQISFMEKNNYHFSYTQYEVIDSSGKSLKQFWTGPKKITKLKMYTYNYMGCLTVMYDSKFMGLIQVSNLKKRNDYAMWLRAVRRCPSYLLKERLSKYRVRPSGSITSRNSGTLNNVKYHFLLFRDGEHMVAAAALFLTCINLVFGLAKKALYRRRIH